MTTYEEVGRLKAQRSRFIAFAFAGNDILMELDADGSISYCAGTVDVVLGCEADHLIHMSIHDLVAERDVPTFHELMVRLRRTGRLDRIPVRFKLPRGGERRLLVSAIVMPETPDSTYLALSPLRGA